MAILDFQCAIVTGGAGGIGRAIAEYLISQGKQVIIVGRTESSLQKTSSEIGATAYYILDTGNLDAIPSFITKVTKEHPTVDCLINNAGVQRPLSITKMEPDEFLTKGTNEIDINVRGPMSLILYLLPHLKTKPNACVMNVTSILGFIPISVINPCYNGTKAFMHFWTTNIRTQLSQDESTKHIKFVEIAPPTVGTDLHREREDPDDNKKGKNSVALSVDEFIKELVEGWKNDETTISAGPGKEIVSKWYATYGEQYEKAAH